MSLLNQVLQDLEKRNAKNTPKEHEPDILTHVRIFSISQHKPYYLIAILLVLAGIIGFVIYHLNSNQITDLATKSQQKLAQAIKDQVVIEEKTVSKVTTPVIATNSNTTIEPPIKLNTITTPKQAIEKIEPAPVELVVKTSIQKLAVIEEKVIPKVTTIDAPQTTKAIIQKVNKPSSKQQAEHYFAQAKKNQSLIDKQALLKQVLTLNPQHFNAHLLLANTLLQQGLTEQAVGSLKHSLKVFPKNIQLTNILAQLFLQSKQHKLALTTLLKINTPYIQNETFLSLLAAAYQQNNDYFNSLNSYQKLLSLNPEKAEYWLGLAIALEKQNKPQHALAAYRQALNKNPLKPVIVSYIKQRISLLN